eukprot:TRINITY_DN4250_c0_g1_i1.p1 TRINITY_DN4250_c0_g1~~TRINITY_DN4250_c0_g1_i1.p1  ORF type:complete len:444 (-),score=93.92 TRINITY_DN4250_c0_g1_i1:1654-2985(-)
MAGPVSDMDIDEASDNKVGSSRLRELLDKAAEVEDVRPEEAIALYKQIIFDAGEEDSVREKASAIKKLGDLLSKLRRIDDLRSLLTSLRPLFGSIPKAKTGLIVKNILDQVAAIPNTTEAQIELCNEWIQWCKEEKRTFLKQRIELRLAGLHLDRKRFNDALEVVTGVIREVKKLDDKELLVELFLLESRVHYALRNVARARASLTTARTNANAIYCPPALQCSIDMQAGTLYAEEHDYKTAYSYFFEAFEGYSNMKEAMEVSQRERFAVLCLKYMLLCKIMTNNPDDVHAIVGGKMALRYAGSEVEAMSAVAQAHKKRSLKDFEVALVKFSKELQEDALIKSHLSALQDTLLEQNLVRIIEPYSKVEITHVAAVIELPLERVEAKLSQMILDKKFEGTLHQGSGCLLVFDPTATDETYPAVLETISSMNKVTDALFEKCKKL